MYSKRGNSGQIHTQRQPVVGYRSTTWLRQLRWQCSIQDPRSGTVHSKALPRNWSEVVRWAQEEFHREVAPTRPDAVVHLAKACLLIALEEEAAFEIHPELEAAVAAMTKELNVRIKSMGSASTWSLERLDSLAAQAHALFLADMENYQGSSVEGTEGPSGTVSAHTPMRPGHASSCTGIANGTGTTEGQGAQLAGAAGSMRHLAGVDAAESSTSSKETVDIPNTMADTCASMNDNDMCASISSASSNVIGSSVTGSKQSDDTVNVTSGAAGGSTSSCLHAGFPLTNGTFPIHQPSTSNKASNIYYSSTDSNTEQGHINTRTTTQTQKTLQAGSTSGADASPLLAAPEAVPAAATAAGLPSPADHPVQALQAINTVLFEWHGYQACNRFGEPRDSHLSSVMERGIGCSAALSLLYLEVAFRLGLPLAARPLEEGRYFVLWPEHQPLSAGAERVVVDPYGCGGLLLVSEVCELFDLASEADLRPASKRELLAALLGDLRDAHWARGVGCSAAPAFMTRLSVEAALTYGLGGADGRGDAGGARAGSTKRDPRQAPVMEPLNYHSLQRALAAAEKRVWLTPQDRSAQLELALLYVFCRRFDDAWIELGVYIEQVTADRGMTAAAAAAEAATLLPALAADAVGISDRATDLPSSYNVVREEGETMCGQQAGGVESAARVPLERGADAASGASLLNNLGERGGAFVHSATKEGEQRHPPAGSDVARAMHESEEKLMLLWEKLRLQLTFSNESMP